MAKKHIDELTLKEIDYAVAVAQGERWLKSNLCTDFRNNHFIFSEYQPTTNQAQCGKLIDDFNVSACYFLDKNKKPHWKCFVRKSVDSFIAYNESRLVAACKAFLWSKYPDGMMPIKETKNE